MNEIIGYFFIGVGLAFDVLGCVGLVRLPDVYTRLQASTKCVTMGTWLILFGAFLITGFSATGIKAILCIIIIAMTSPTAAHALARGAHIFQVKLWKGSVVDKYKEDLDEQKGNTDR